MKKFIRAISVFLVACLGVLGFAACGEEEIADNTKYYDSVTKSLKLEKAYEGKNFFNDGIGEAKLKKNTDGDTTDFTLVVPDSLLGSAVTIRYFCIDTPESTGGVQKWGKSASLFTKNKLDNATEIVLEASETPAVKDSYGTRYLGYVWYKQEGDTEFKNLNVEIVENGYSENKAESLNPYYSYFKKANDFAKSIELRIYSELEDPLYSTDPTDVTIKDLNENMDEYYNAELDSGAKVRFNGYLTDLYVSNTMTYTFTAQQYDPETGEVYSISVYAGYTSASGSKMVIGHYYQFVGSVQNHYGKMQISGIVYSAIYKEPDNTHVKQNNYYFTFDSNTAYSTNNRATLYSDLTVMEATVEGTTLTIKATAQKCARDSYEEAVPFTLQVPVSAGYTSTFAAGDKLSLHAYNFDSTNFDSTKDVLQVLKLADISKK